MNTETMARLADQTEDALVALHGRLDAGEIVVEEFIALATSVLLRAKARGVALADLALAAELSVLRRQVVTAVGLEVPDDAARATTEAVEDTLGTDAYAADAVAAVAVLGRAEALASVQEAYGRGMTEQGVAAWTRDLNDGACELCQALAGEVLPGYARMYHHKGCGCSQRPVEEIEA